MATEPKTPDHPDFDNNPEWTRADFAKARPASEMLPLCLQPPRAEWVRGCRASEAALKPINPRAPFRAGSWREMKGASVDDFLAERRLEAEREM